MYPHLGMKKPGSTVFIPFHTFDSNDPSASVTISDLATTDIEVYKDASMTQRASDSGYALVDTDGIDLDAVTGIHGFTIDLSDNTTAGFWEAGSDYIVVVSSITVDAATINFIAARFTIGYDDAIINTSIATLSTQTSFTLTNGPAEDDALNGCVVCIHDVASNVQLGFAVISDYTGSTKTVTLTSGTSFTIAAGDNISIFPPANTRWFGQVAQAGDGTNLTEAGGTGDHLTALDIQTIEGADATDQINAACDLAISDASLATAAALATVDGIVDAILVDTSTTIPSILGTPAGADLATDIAGIKTTVDVLELGIITGSAQTGTLSTTQATTDLSGYSDDQLIGRVILWTSGACEGEATDITDSALSGGLLTFTALTTSPANGDTFKIV